MNQDNNFPRFGQQGAQQYGLGSFDMPPPRKSLIGKMFGPAIGAKFSSPLFATGALLLAGVAFAGIIVAAYPDSEGDVDIPVVQADTLAYKEIPAEPGGMEIPNRDSTVFSAMSGDETPEPAPIENLLADDEQVDKLAAFARQVEETMEQDQKTAEEAVVQDLSTMAAAEAAEETAPVTLQKIAKQTEQTTTEQVAAAMEIAATKTEPAERPKIMHKPGENPETLEFVKSVLDKKDGKVVADQVASVAPAAGNALRDSGRSFTITPGSYYVQLGSVKSLDGAEGEWGKLQKAFSAELGSLPHRVKAADLGERGTFYRIQAGPMSKASAGEICDSIKAQKPGGCLVTQ